MPAGRPGGSGTAPPVRPASGPALRAADLTFAYRGAGENALDAISLAVGRGDFVLLAGPSGCGKTTLAHAFTGFVPHYYDGKLVGRVLVEGRDTRSASIPQLAQLIGLVQQDPDGQLCTLRVRDEVAFGPENLALPEPEVAERVERSLVLTGAGHLAARHTATLSGGERQRVAIASILAMGPRLLMLDEPLASLDGRGGRALLTALRDLHGAGGRTIVVAEHRFRRLVPLASRLVLMEQGRVVADDGDPAAAAAAVTSPIAALPPPDPVDRSGPPLLEAAGVHFAWPAAPGRRPASPLLRGVDLRLWPGELVCLRGDNGSGKTTLLKVLLGLLPGRCRRLIVAGGDLRRAAPARRARLLGMVFQNPNHQIFGKTVLEDALMAAQHLGCDGTVAKKRVTEILGRLGLGDRLNDNPLALSHGQKKRLVLAGVLGYGPRVLLLDEPFAGQDDGFAAEVIRTVRRFCCERGGGALVVNHDPDLAAACAARILTLAGGEVSLDVAPATRHQAFRGAAGADLRAT